MSRTRSLSKLIGPSGSQAFDTNTLVIDAANNRVGIGTTSPTGKLEIQGAAIGNAGVDVDYFKALKLSLPDATEWGGQAQFSVGRWEENAANARSSLVISLGHGALNSDTDADVDVMTLL